MRQQGNMVDHLLARVIIFVPCCHYLDYVFSFIVQTISIEIN